MTPGALDEGASRMDALARFTRRDGVLTMHWGGNLQHSIPVSHWAIVHRAVCNNRRDRCITLDASCIHVQSSLTDAALCSVLLDIRVCAGYPELPVAVFPHISLALNMRPTCSRARLHYEMQQFLTGSGGVLNMPLVPYGHLKWQVPSGCQLHTLLTAARFLCVQCMVPGDPCVAETIAMDNFHITWNSFDD